MSNFKFNLVIKSVDGGISEVSSFVKMYEKLDEISDYLLEVGGLANNRKAREIEDLLKKVRGES